jgi:hypothetical protein
MCVLSISRYRRVPKVWSAIEYICCPGRDENLTPCELLLGMINTEHHSIWRNFGTHFLSLAISAARSRLSYKNSFRPSDKEAGRAAPLARLGPLNTLEFSFGERSHSQQSASNIGLAGGAREHITSTSLARMHLSRLQFPPPLCVKFY